MTSLTEIRERFPQYADVSDGDLLMALNREMYPQMHPRAFLDAIDGATNAQVTISRPELKEFWQRGVTLPMPGESQRDAEMRAGGTSFGPTDPGGRGMAGVRSYMQGMSLGGSDEATAGMTSLATGNPYEFELEKERRRLAQGEQQYPVQSGLAEIGGALTMPAAAIQSPLKAGAVGTASGMGMAFGKGEGGAQQRATDAAAAAPASALFSFGSIPVQRGLQKGLRRLIHGAQAKPSIPLLRRARTEAYEAVDNSGFTFDPTVVDGVLTKIYATLDDPTSGYVVSASPRVDKAKRILEANWGDTKTLSQMDKIRSRLWDVWDKAPKDEARLILGMINEIDDAIEASLGGDPIMQTAREAHKALMRTEYLDAAFRKAEGRTAATGSGGNIYNNYAKVFEKIIDDPKLSRKFTDEQLEFFRIAVDTPLPERTMRKLGKLSPDGNGLMLALTAIGGSIDPSMFALGGVGAMAKYTSDAAMAERVDRALGLTSGMKPRPAYTPSNVPGAAAIGGLSMDRKGR